MVLKTDKINPRTKQAMKPLILVLQEREDASNASAIIPLSSSLAAEASSVPRRAFFNLSIL